MFPGNGRRPLERKMDHGKLNFLELPDGMSPDVVAFFSRPEDEGGLHAAVQVTGEGHYVVPPNALITLRRYREAGTWTTATGAKPACGVYEVNVTYSSGNSTKNRTCCTMRTMIDTGL